MNTTTLDVLATAQRLQLQDQPCALVTVLRVQAPASARPGDKAVVTADGFAAGWVGGGCAQPAVLRTVREALADGRARLIRIAPAAEGEVRELGDVLEFGMACHSGGTLELFIDPLLPRARLVVLGDSPVAVALARLAPHVGLAVTVVAQGADASRFPDAEQVITSDDPEALGRQVGAGALVVVATQGRRDLQGLRAALALQARHTSFVASARKAQVLRQALIEAGHEAAAVNAIVSPVGQAIGAQTPQEIALSVLAAVVAARRALAGSPAQGLGQAPDAQDRPVTADTGPAMRPEPAPVAVVAAMGASTMPEAASAGAPGGSCCGSASPRPALPAVAAASPVPASAAPVRSCCSGG